MLQERTYSTIALMDAIDLFHTVGHPVQSNVARVSSWKEAIERRQTYRSRLWETSIHNKLYNSAKEPLTTLERFSSLITEIRGLVNPVVVKKVNPLIEKDETFYRVSDYVSWDFLRIAINSELSDIVSVSEYAQVLNWYACGHFPCGWKGKGGEKYPKGRLVVY